MNNRIIQHLIAIFTLLLCPLATAEFPIKEQTGKGTITMIESHGEQIYCFIPEEGNKEELRMVKMAYKRMGFKDGLPEKLEEFFSKAYKEKSEVELSCKFYDKGPGKKTSIAIEVLDYKEL